MVLIVVTGANGFIGTNICNKLLALQPEDLGFDKQGKKTFSNFDETSASNFIEVIGTDLPESLNRDTAKRFIGSSRYTYCDYEQLIETLNKRNIAPNIIIHNGACSSTTETDKNIFAKLNVNYSKSMWNYCTKNQVPLIYASSAAVYGDGLNGFSDKKEDCHKYKSLNLYGQSKLDFDLWVLEQKQTPPTWFGLRYFNVFGQFEGHKKGQASMVYHGYHQAMRAQKIKLFKSNDLAKYKDGEQLRDFIYVDDIVDITVSLTKLSIERKKEFDLYKKVKKEIHENGLFLNLGRGVTETWNTLATHVFNSLGMTVNIEYIDIPTNIVNQYQNYTCANLETLRNLGVTHTFRSFEESVKRYIHEHLIRSSTL